MRVNLMVKTSVRHTNSVHTINREMYDLFSVNHTINSRSYYKIITLGFIYVVSMLAITKNTGESNNSIYIISLVYLIISMPVMVRVLSYRRLQYLDIIPLLFFFMWLIGLIFGFLNENDTVSITRNFAGMAVFLIYYPIVYSGFDAKDVLIVLRNISIAYCLYMLFLFASGSRIPSDVIGYGLADYRFYYNQVVIYMIPILVIYFSTLAFKMPYKVPLSIIYLSAALGFLLSIILTGSKGFVGGLVISLSLIFMLLWYRWRVKLGFLLFFISLILLAAISGLATFLVDLYEVIVLLELDPEHHRSIQAKELLNAITILPQGLGANISGYSRDPLGYGFELTYHSIAHKYGILSVFLFSLYLWIIAYSSYSICKGKNDLIYHLASLSIMISLMVASYGNPILFSPISVLLVLFSIILSTGTKYPNQTFLK